MIFQLAFFIELPTNFIYSKRVQRIGQVYTKIVNKPKLETFVICDKIGMAAIILSFALKSVYFALHARQCTNTLVCSFVRF